MFRQSAKLITLLCAFPVSLFAQFTPVIAHVTQDVQITKDGKVVETHQRSGTFYRSAKGSEVYRWETKDGSLEYEGSLNDNNTGIAYQLDFRASRAIQTHQGKPLPAGLLSEDKACGRPRDSVEGISCVVYTYGNQKSCMSIDYFLTLWNDVTFPTPDDPSKTYHMVARMSDIKLNAEIDPNVFDPQKAFAVLKSH